MSNQHDEAVAYLRARDRRLARIIDRVGACRLTFRRSGTHFEALCRAIAYQQVTGAAAATIFGRLRALGEGGRFPTATRVLDLGDARLRSAGLSRQKAAAIRDLAEKTTSGVVSLARLGSMESDAVIETLTQVRGVGVWTAEMLLLFRLARPDVLSATDYGIRKGVMVVDARRELPSPKEVTERGVVWSPYRSVASWYLWRAAELK
ncbi:MAG: DNA-3-methyladenine glycosylase 2 family protein [Myxococcota bacterium]